MQVSSSDTITLDGQPVEQRSTQTTVMLNKPAGYVVSRNGQGSKTVYDLLPASLRHLKPIGRLDKDSSGLLLLTDDGILANQLTHPRYSKTKVYELELNKALETSDKQAIEKGVELDDGPSVLRVSHTVGRRCTVAMSEGRNRQIRRTFAARGHSVIKLHRTRFGDYALPEGLMPGKWIAA